MINQHTVRLEAADVADLQAALDKFASWLSEYGETSWDHQSYFAGSYGRWAKALYYRRRWVGMAGVAPMILSEAFFPAARQLFHHRIRFPIADAHYAMGFASLYEATGDDLHLKRAIHFLHELQQSRAPGFKEYGWGYPFDWVTRNGVMKANTPLITSTPYMYEAFLQVYRLTESTGWKDILASIARHASQDFKDFPTSERASSCSYNPYDGGGVVNAAAYRAFLLTSASGLFGDSRYAAQAERNLRFVLESQNSDGSWPYAVDGFRPFVDHFHTCFVIKSLAKIHELTHDQETWSALQKGISYYASHLFDNTGMPRPFAKAPRLTVYKNELYDCAECINLCVLLSDRFPELATTAETVTRRILRDWIRPNGSFRARKLLAGWDNVPMHRWAQSQMFRSLAVQFAYLKRNTSLRT